jgi:hypothetical protein
MKKSSKSKKTPAPAKKPTPIVRKAPVPTPVVKKTAPKIIATVISAHLDVGFGNRLYIRGEGPGLSWNKGLAMECVADDRWSLSLPESARPVVFKFVMNDEVWSTGDDYTAAPGVNVILTPTF